MKQAVEERTDHVVCAGDRMRFLHLSENLRLSDHQRVQPRCDAEQMASDIEIGYLVDVRLQRLPIDLVKIGDEVDERRSALMYVITHAVQFGAVARGEHNRLAHRGALSERPERHLQTARLKIDPLTQFDRRCAVTDSNKYEMHGPLTASPRRHEGHEA